MIPYSFSLHLFPSDWICLCEFPFMMLRVVFSMVFDYNGGMKKYLVFVAPTAAAGVAVVTFNMWLKAMAQAAEDAEHGQIPTFER